MNRMIGSNVGYYLLYGALWLFGAITALAVILGTVVAVTGTTIYSITDNETGVVTEFSRWSFNVDTYGTPALAR